ncbi:MAG: TetR/AcrR family transcriptional regulator, partial [Thermoanaerobaculales bacterium]|nr:TetR/AcrR family transcriptional regulator [Thermoanaerobaculales bacterium]
MARYSEKQKAALDALMKDDVHDHAMEIIRSDGIDGLTMERLANEIGVSRGTLYNYFDDKDAVIDHVEDRCFGEILAAIEKIVAGSLPPDEKMAAIADWIFTEVYEDRALFMALKPIKHMRATRECHLERHNRAMRLMRQVIEDGIEQGVFRKLSPEIVGEAFLGSITGMLEAMFATGEFYRAEAVVPTLM